MDPLFSDLLLVDEERAFKFFATCLSDVVEGAACDDALPRVARDEFLYVSSILAHYALVQGGNAGYLPIPGTLRQLHDLFVTNVETWHDPELMETAAAQALMLTGYFAGGMRLRHSLKTYVWWGRFFFGQAASHANGRKQTLLEGMSVHFPVWRQHLERLHGQLWEDRFLLAASPPEPGHGNY